LLFVPPAILPMQYAHHRGEPDAEIRYHTTQEDSKHPLLTSFSKNSQKLSVTFARSGEDKLSVALEPSCVVAPLLVGKTYVKS